MMKKLRLAIIVITILSMLVPTSVLSMEKNPEGNWQANIAANINPGISRYTSQPRVTLSLKVADALKKDLNISRFDTIFVVSENDTAAQTASSPLAIKKSAPIILLDKSGDNSKVYKYIKKNLSANGTIYYIGNSNYVSGAVESRLKALGNVKLISGKNTCDTNLKLLSEQNVRGKDLIIATEKGASDAIVASATGKSLLLVGDSLTKSQKKFLEQILTSTSRVFIIGSESAVSKKVENDLSAYTSPIRVSGANKYKTATAAARMFFKSSESAFFISSEQIKNVAFVGPLARVRRSAILYSCNSKFEHTYNYVVAHSKVKSALVFGAKNELSDDATGISVSGAKKTGLLKVGKNSYFSNTSGSLLKNQLITSGDDSYYATKNGILSRNNLIKIDGDYYVSKSDCKIAKDEIITLGGTKYFASQTGVLYKNGYLVKNGRTYHFNNKCVMDLNTKKPTSLLKVSGYYISPMYAGNLNTAEERIEAMIQRAYDYKKAGSKYKWFGSAQPGAGVDCSGLVLQCLYAAGYDPSPNSPEYYSSREFWKDFNMKQVSLKKLKRGDLIYYGSPYNHSYIFHIAIYLGNGKVIESWPPGVSDDKKLLQSPHQFFYGAMRPFE